MRHGSGRRDPPRPPRRDGAPARPAGAPHPGAAEPRSGRPCNASSTPRVTSSASLNFLQTAIKSNLCLPTVKIPSTKGRLHSPMTLSRCHCRKNGHSVCRLDRTECTSRYVQKNPLEVVRQLPSSGGSTNANFYSIASGKHGYL